MSNIDKNFKSVKEQFHFLSSRKFIALPHRGAHFFSKNNSNQYLENTHSAFSKARDLGFTHIETDVHASKDSISYMIHDPTLKRLTGDDIALKDLTSKDIEKIRLKGSHLIPKLEETLEEFPSTYFNIDAKSWRVADPLASVINKTETCDRICIASFNDQRISYIRNLIKGSICFSAGTLKSLSIMISLRLGVISDIDVPCLELPLFYKGIKILNRSLIEKIKLAGTRIIVWVINNENHINELIDYGVDGLIVDDCLLLKKILIKKGLW